MDQEKTYKWIQDRLRELNAGTIAEADFHRLETLAKEDPFVADALEGYQSHPDLDHTEYLDSLAERIKPYKRERRRWLIPNLTVTAVAASLILIVGFYAVLTRMSTNDNKDLVGATAEHQLSIEKSGDTFSIVPNEDDNIVAAESSQPAGPVEEPRKETSRQAASKSVAPKEKKITVTSADMAKSTTADQPMDIVDTKTKGVSPPFGDETIQLKADEQPAAPVTTEAKDAGFYANQIDPAMMARRVSGKVVDITKEGLIGAVILVHATNIINATDLDGNFEFYLPKEENEVTVSYTGYRDTSFTIEGGEADLIITLKEQLADMPGAIAQSVSPKKATPKLNTTGFQSRNEVLFIDYLKTNSKYPLAENLNTPAKIVTLEFFIGSEGHPGQVKVIQSSGEKNLDDEAVRLIRKGPDWNCGTAQYPCKVVYSIYFRA